MGKKNKVKAKNDSAERKESPSEEKTTGALKPVAKITKTPIQNKTLGKDPKLTPGSKKRPKKANKKESTESNAAEVNVKGLKDETKEAVPKGKTKEAESEVQKGKDGDNPKKTGKDKKNDGRDSVDNSKIGGLIFMCNAKTKPDIFKYMVMGFPNNRTELVMRVKPGVKLFLYDYDSKLLHGIYKATSEGGVHLERAAFGGSFPAQVRFKVDKDCAPMPMSEVRKKFIEIFDAKKGMFSCELSPQQAQKLVSLLTTPSARPKGQLVTQKPQLPFTPFVAPVTTVPIQGPLLVHHGHVHEGGLLPPRELAPRVPASLTEKDYRTYGLQPRQTAPAPVPPLTAGPRQPYDVPVTSDLRNAAYGNPTYPVKADRDRLPYADTLRGYDSIAGYYSRREPDYGTLVSDRLRAYETETSHSAYAATALSDYSRRQQQPGSSSDFASLPVSSRYAFAGPTPTYR